MHWLFIKEIVCRRKVEEPVNTKDVGDGAGLLNKEPEWKKANGKRMAQANG